MLTDRIREVQAAWSNMDEFDREEMRWTTEYVRLAEALDALVTELES